MVAKNRESRVQSIVSMISETINQGCLRPSPATVSHGGLYLWQVFGLAHGRSEDASRWSLSLDLDFKQCLGLGAYMQIVAEQQAQRNRRPQRRKADGDCVRLSPTWRLRIAGPLVEVSYLLHGVAGPSTLGYKFQGMLLTLGQVWAQNTRWPKQSFCQS
eukprot:5042200-Amphidinium_carterae.1